MDSRLVRCWRPLLQAHSTRASVLESSRRHGNPLALLELCRGLSAAELAGGFALPHAGDLPTRIDDQYVKRLRELPRVAQRLVLLAAADPVEDSARTMPGSNSEPPASTCDNCAPPV